MLKAQLRRSLPLAIAAIALFASAATGFAEEAAAGQQNIFQTIVHGGPAIISIWLCILGTSVTMVTFIVQGLLILRKEKLAPPALVENLQQNISAGNYQEAWEVANSNSNYVANVIKAALSRIGRGSTAVEEAIIEHGAREASLLKTRNSYLSVIGVISPMIGLLGTVIGMMGAFSVLAGSGISDPRALAGRIGEVLLATASGLFIAIPAFIFYYVFRNKAQAVVVHADDVVHSLVQDIPFAELEGVKIGADFDSGAGVPAGGAKKVSLALTTNCPVCSGAVTPGVNPCPHCGSTLDWSA